MYVIDLYLEVLLFIFSKILTLYMYHVKFVEIIHVFLLIFSVFQQVCLLFTCVLYDVQIFFVLFDKNFIFFIVFRVYTYVFSCKCISFLNVLYDISLMNFMFCMSFSNFFLMVLVNVQFFLKFRMFYYKFRVSVCTFFKISMTLV